MVVPALGPRPAGAMRKWKNVIESTSGGAAARVWPMFAAMKANNPIVVSETILLSGSTKDLVRDIGIKNSEYKDLSERRLSGTDVKSKKTLPFRYDWAA